MDGDSVTVNVDGIYSIAYTDGGSVNTEFGISVNSNQLTTDITGAGNDAFRRTIGNNNANNFDQVSVTLRLSAGDVIRPHTRGSNNDATNIVQFIVTQVAKL